MSGRKEFQILIDWKDLLLKYYKLLSLSEEEVMIILMTDFCILRGEKLITPETLSLKMSMSFQDIDRLFSKLSNQGVIAIKEDENGHLYTSLEEVKTIVFAYFENENEKSKVKVEAGDDLFSIFEKGFGRLLSAIEVDTIRFWIENGYSEDEIKAALYEALNSNVRNIKYIDKILLKWHQEKEQKQEGFSTVTEQWRGDIKKTMEIANLNWVNKK